MDFYISVTIIVALSLLYYGYDKKKGYEIKAKELELEQKKLELEIIKMNNELHNNSNESKHS